MTSLPERPNLEHLKKQAKDLLRAYRASDPSALARIRDSLPAAAGRDTAAIAAQGLRLRDAQSCIAREYEFASWVDLATYVEAQTAARGDRVARVRSWLDLVYSGEVSGQFHPARPQVAIRMLADDPGLATGSPYLACAVGDLPALREATAADPAWVNRPGGPLNLPPLVAVTHSSLVRVPELRERLREGARCLLEAGADPNQKIGNRWPPASLAAPDDTMPLSALYGAAGSNHDPKLTQLLLEAGADPNDGESLYHSLEFPECTRLLLQHGARIAGTNAMYRALDLADPAALELLLAHGGDANEPARNAPLTDWGSPLMWAIRRRRSVRHVRALLAAGADPAARTPDGITAPRLALQFGLLDVAELLGSVGAIEPLTEEEQFIAACTRGDAAEARRIQARRPDLPGSLPPARLRLLPDMVAEGGRDAAMVMVSLGWPIATRGGDWKASALNLAVFQGDAALTQFLLEHGASWQEEEHGYGDNVRGTLSWASCVQPTDTGDWVGCARALRAHGMPVGAPDPARSDIVVFDGRAMRFSDDVAEVLSRTGDGAG